MEGKWQAWLARWQAAGLIDESTAAAIRAHEAAHATPPQHRAAIFAFGFGGVLVGAGILLFVASHWADLAPAARFGLVMAMVAVLHLGGALAATRLPPLATTLHAVGTAALGAGIFLAGQIFNMAEHWPAAVLLWALGAAFALALLRDWPQALWVAMLAPAWLIGEWAARALGEAHPFEIKAITVGCVALGTAYVAASGPGLEAAWRRALARLGDFVLLGAAFMLQFAAVAGFGVYYGEPSAVNLPLVAAIAVLLPLAVGYALRGRDAWPVGVALVLAALVTLLDPNVTLQRLGVYLLYAAGSIAMVLWGLAERSATRVNLGVAGFALTVLYFYFGSLFDMLGRAFGLIGMGALFIGGGWLLERTRRRLLTRVREGGA